MKKILKNIMLSALTVASVASCVDDRNNFLPDDSFGFNNAENDNVVTLPIYGGSYDIAIIKSGKGLNEGIVDISTSNADLIAYNKEFETSYFPLPKDSQLYSFNTESISFGTKEVTKSVTLSWDIAKVAEYMSKKPENSYCIPVVLRSDNLEVNDGRNLFILNLVKSTVSAEQTLLSKTIEWESAPAEETMNITVRIDKAIPGIDLAIDFDVDESLVAAYNEANGTAYALAPEGLVTLGNDPTIKAGESYALLPVTINTAALVDEATGLVKTDWDGYVAPVKIKGMNIDGVEMDNGLTYVVVKGLEPVPPQLFDRLWGIYATSSTNPWQTTFGISDARNITMDDNYIYIPQNAGGTPVLKAVSIHDPAVVKNVNLEGVGGKTTETHVLSCVRILPTADGDKLIACNLTAGEDDFTFYVWHDGIDAAPTAYVVAPSGRRLGDKFIVNGTFEAGEIYCKDYNSGNIVRYGMTGTDIGEWRGATVSYARGRYDFSASILDAANCIGSPYIYPGTEKAGTDIVPGFLYTSTASGHYLTHSDGIIFASSADLSLGMTHGYNFFSDEKTGLNYVAYVSVGENQNQGSVKVISDFKGTPEGLVEVLQAQTTVFEAPIQDGMDATVVSPCPATHSTGDCVVREINGETYMAVMIQNVGISVFKMNSGFIAE